MAFELPYPFFFLLLLQILPFSIIAQTYNNISLGSSLTTKDNNNSVWCSPSGEFAFGFQKIGSDVWSANGNNLVLTAHGQLMLNDIATGKQKWIADFGGTGVAYVAMLDTGNFVLANRNLNNLRESFDQPTDTILPTQTLKLNNTLLASYTASNYSRGRFQFALQSDGALLLYTTNFPLDTLNYVYWSTHTEGSGFEVIFNHSGSIYLTATNGSILYIHVVHCLC
ncbi:hypothetical protein ACE6H2_011254 [Prunus campanulata]